ncbi:D-hexose-6-phosphate mutarotase [Shewanella sedimentimangrovi]|uniref:Putative glucose-6-phosphate 1-epimerase n=1 Tax=Shewanella sedimentimangrovi TaxID=2814293 RepID=A0ABX7QWE4_9GAMM|nr:D-hexose-6-phosphate mutarotase [Shewanella sedimentimangrovi]QSX35817.1 D-hexose-6-phosphate mutarotase [Shewanella sedimentimangrovi]
MGKLSRHQHPNGLEYLQVESALCQARIFFQGAQIDSFIPTGKAPLLWVSDADDYSPGNGIRGGIPVCWPWFGMDGRDGFPQHGFARTREWQLLSHEWQGEVLALAFGLEIQEADRRFWPHNSQVELHFLLGESLTVSLINRNLGQEPVRITQALHSYFPIGDIHALRATGFAGARYIEFGEGPYAQDGDEVHFDRETDRVYTQLGAVQQLHTTDGTIEVSREHSHSAVLWNPWIDKSKRLARFNDEDYLTMVCLEAANVLEDALELAPGESHCLTTRIRWC